MSDAADIVIVGGGPTTARALADLDDELAARIDGGERMPSPRITVIDPSAHGGGSIWSTEQPEHLVMNVNADIVDLSCASVPWSYRLWPGASPEAYPPRANVSAYLESAMDMLAASPRLSLTRLVGSVDSVARLDGHWVVRWSGGNGAIDDGEILAPLVLLATGHASPAQPDHASIMGGDWEGRDVTVRGGALTAYDVVLDLTAGRGGSWAAMPDGRLRYVASGREPRRIQLSTRTGAVLSPKPDEMDPAVGRAARAVTAGLPDHARPDNAWWSVVREAAHRAAAAAGVTVTLTELDGIWLGRDETLSDDALTQRNIDRWASDRARAGGHLDADPAWWWGRAWAAGYRDIVRSLARGARDPETWPVFLERAGRLERYAFGPPAATVERLLALSEAGILSWRTGMSPSDRIDIDAVTASGGILRVARPWNEAADIRTVWRQPWAALLSDGHVHVRPGERGVLTDEDGTCISRDGRPSPGLAALGRPTQDPLIDHDSLQRRLHPETGRWAAATARSLAGSAVLRGSRQ